MNESYKTDYLMHIKNVGMLWYIVDPFESRFESVAEVPDYQYQAWFPFFILIIMEQLVLLGKKKSTFRLNDHITSLSHWMLQESGRIFFRGAEYYMYIYIYNKYHVLNLPWNSLWTWYLTLIGVDFCYYWVHRLNHEVHFLWSQHQVHHSSEEFNLVVGLRQSILQQWCSFMFYLPLALFIPPSNFITHHQFNLIYQLWIHTTVINDLGLLEFIFNTPKHHRVHHGCNLYCLDKNYGGVFIIWDRLFGTFMNELPDKNIIYGLVVSPRTFNPIYLQTFYTKAMIDKSKSMKTISDKLSAYWKGPSWFPGSPRLGLDEYKINVTSRNKYDPLISTWLKLYILLHFSIAFYMHFYIYSKEQDCALLIMNNIFALTSIGLLFDKFKYANIIELTRCIVNLVLFNNNIYYISYIYVLSSCLWIINLINSKKKNC
ncbi:alkylglycerol monooxygenase-like isoform X1 [Microplitis mediator]|uniref:alkylglycerol monooxygenase-like isoform X1 n=1 Tax=Microplitis mediator TaxID=375433 RepID=UPI0025560837|nr:alkylglycerol monooxygenase-like isoform X1 [Microplitis mediator]XP_057336019.1 alkylglycerol monooxygenase-like isoform X1 [Microplitis mediator]XP_057336020.1 alkylglycerol monooxygenase-like isoform X1 [Microplitis mediator]XP_057336021.1 alkylglycerol monooxygenase-like isoform X1 [Microplitis mediator]